MTTKNYAINKNGTIHASIMRFKTSRLFLWSCMEDKVYANACQSIQELKEKIRAVIDKRKCNKKCHEKYFITKNQMIFHKKQSFFL